MVTPLSWQLEDDTRLLQQVGFDVPSGQFAGCSEVNSNKLTLWMKSKTSICLSALQDVWFTKILKKLPLCVLLYFT